MQSAGETWRQIRNGPITVYGGWLLVAVHFSPLRCFTFCKGALKVHGKPTGRMIERFSTWERMVHWTTAISFCILAVTGVITIFGKYVLLPMFGYTLFSWLAIFAKNLHNFVGPLFIVLTAGDFPDFCQRQYAAGLRLVVGAQGGRTAFRRACAVRPLQRRGESMVLARRDAARASRSA